MKHTFKTTNGALLSEVLADEYPWLSRNKIKRLVSDKNIKVNGKRVSGDGKLTAGDEIEAYVPDFPVVSVIYSDENIVVADKPNHVDSVTALPKLLFAEYGEIYPVHRLDTNTTGIVVLARGVKTKAELEKAFREHTVRKKYIATVVGKPKKSKGTLRGWLVKDSANGRVKVSDVPVKGGVEAVTDYEVTDSADGLTTLALMPLTGRTHQLRAQLAHIGCPILGDGKYGDFATNRKHGAKEQQLRAVSIKFLSLGGIINYLSGREFEVKPL